MAPKKQIVFHDTIQDLQEVLQVPPICTRDEITAWMTVHRGEGAAQRRKHFAAVLQNNGYYVEPLPEAATQWRDSEVVFADCFAKYTPDEVEKINELDPEEMMEQDLGILRQWLNDPEVKGLDREQLVHAIMSKRGVHKAAPAVAVPSTNYNILAPGNGPVTNKLPLYTPPGSSAHRPDSLYSFSQNSGQAGGAAAPSTSNQPQPNLFGAGGLYASRHSSVDRATPPVFGTPAPEINARAETPIRNTTPLFGTPAPGGLSGAGAPNRTTSSLFGTPAPESRSRTDTPMRDFSRAGTPRAEAEMNISKLKEVTGTLDSLLKTLVIETEQTVRNGSDRGDKLSALFDAWMHSGQALGIFPLITTKLVQDIGDVLGTHNSPLKDKGHSVA